jgi:hypothetical protein
MVFLNATYLRFWNDCVSNDVSPDPNVVTKAVINEGYFVVCCGRGTSGAYSLCVCRRVASCVGRQVW